MKPTIFLFIWAMLLKGSLAAQTTPVVVKSAQGQPIPFASVKFNNGQGTLAGIHGEWILPIAQGEQLTYADITAVGYLPKRVALPLHDSIIVLATDNHALDEVVITPNYGKLKRIIALAIANRS
ncbi:MAG: hypothetical protein EBZ77_07425, partial [Chitinophagia bacterium]|nr:hypothetical protein [Chitinophagia bacterium]